MEVPDFGVQKVSGTREALQTMLRVLPSRDRSGVKAEGQHRRYAGRFPESKHKPGLGTKPFIVISVFVKSVARSEKPLFSSSKC